MPLLSPGPLRGRELPIMILVLAPLASVGTIAINLASRGAGLVGVPAPTIATALALALGPWLKRQCLQHPRTMVGLAAFGYVLSAVALWLM